MQKRCMTIKDKIVEKLILSKEPISGEQLAKELCVSRSAIWKHIQALRAEGYMIKSSTKLGYALADMPDVLTPAMIKAGLKTSIMGRDIHYFKETESTNTIAMEIANMVEEGTVVIAESQTRGRGRMGRKWLSPEGGIWLSIILKPRIKPWHVSRITILTGVSVAKTIRSYALDARIKWPNDILINEKKVCGILTELEAEIDQVEYCVVGIGIDANVDIEVFPEETRENSTSLRKELGKHINRGEFVQRLLEEIEKEYMKLQRSEFPSILDEWRAMSATIGEWVKITTSSRTIYGEAIGVDNDGALILETGEGKLEKIVAGTCEHLRR